MDRTAMRSLRPLPAAAAAAVLALVGAVLVLVPARIERRVRELAAGAAARRGVALRIARVRFAWLGPLRLEGVSFRRDGLEGEARGVAVSWRPAWRAASWPRAVRLEGLALRSGETSLSLADSRWELVALARGRAEVVQRASPASSLSVAWSEASGIDVRPRGYDLDALLTIRRHGAVAGRLGRVTGRLAFAAPAGGAVGFDLLAAARGVRVASVADPDEGAAPPSLGAPMDLELAASGTFVPAWHRVSLDCWRMETSGVSMAGAGALEEGADDVWADVTLDVPRFELARVIAASGLTLDIGGGRLPADLGSASLTAELSGHLRDPDSIAVDQRLVFHRPSGGVPALAYLNGPFTHTVELEDGDVRILVKDGAPDYVPLEDVPPLFVRALTLSEDAAFWGHPGIDLTEIPVALATNWKRGERARGGSTITQQLVKNLFLSRRKSVGRKLQEAALALLVESAVPKRRILEIYLNVIEWGPRVYGLRPAARRYFGKEPRDLTPKEAAFLVALIPGPIKYQRSFAGGALTPRFGALVTGVLAKLRSVDALSEEEYERALEEPLLFAPPIGPGPVIGPGPPAEAAPQPEPEPPTP